MLFYLLGNTTSEYFCYSLESLSSLLKLSPTLVGVTLLSLSNGAPDVFSSAVSFIDSGTQDIALNTVLGGALFVTCVVMPFNLPRRFTIPRACKDRWSKPVAVVSVTLAPILISVLWDFQDDNTGLMIYGIGCLFGLTFGVLSYLKTEKSSPPDKCLFSCLAGGFIMSVIWSCITTQELVGLLISLGYILGISHTILGLTALAWGNSVGDLITNLTMALNGGPQGAQVALSGCYAGPIFNTLFGLGLSLVSSTWCRYLSPVKIPKDPYLLEPLGFLTATLIWTLLVLPMKDMRLDGVLGGGLFLIYFISISLRLVQVVEPLQLHTFT
ncbi:hypothetical protein Golax_014983 [Gossypium laxum]|uniref:Sodium/calcium exchanger membrane region domain-containing protein n=1 Tax=Gossypium laxum TaxID=34288 RepID=A0A7J8ZWX6_9ROSI|nr:hypothetical protein [Gossypium laxum]